MILSDDIFTHEADAFIGHMPSSLQSHQAEAVARAIDGDSYLLNMVRSSRNTQPQLPDGVVASSPAPNLRLYTPVSRSRQLPLLVYFHGGGWTFGSINSCSAFCAALVARGDVMVLAVDYRLVPENPYPAGLDDCVDAIEFARKHALDWGADPLRISAGGDSSGGNLAIASSLRLPDALSSLVLFYPVTKAFADGSQSWNTYGKGYGLDARLMEEFNRAYTIDANALHPLISPACAPFAALTHLPPVLLIGAGRDILCQQGTDFAALLGSLGVEVEHIMIQGAVHLFITVDGQPTARRQSVDIAHRWLSRKQ